MVGNILLTNQIIDRMELKIDSWQSARKPLISGITTAVFLDKLQRVEPVPLDIDEQADYFGKHFGSPLNKTNEDFSNAVFKELRETNSSCKTGKSDILFLMDGSSSVGWKSFTKAKNFIKRIVDDFYVAGNRVRIGFAQFTSEVRNEFYLAENLNKSSVKQAINDIEYMQGGTKIGKALYFSMSKLIRAKVLGQGRKRS